MTAAQALTPGLSAPSSTAPSAGGKGGERGASFRDTLERASRPGSQPSKGSSESARLPRSGGTGGSGPAKDGEAAVGQPGVVGQEAGSPAAPPVVAQAQGAAAAAAGEDLDSAALLARRLEAGWGQTAEGAQGGDPAERGPWLPGMVSDDDEVLDAHRLLALMRSDPSAAARSAAGPLVVTVLGEERHLALGRVSPEIAGALAQEPQTLDMATALRGEGKAAAAGAALGGEAQAARDDGAERTRGRSASEDMGRMLPEAGVSGRRGALFAHEGRGQSGPALGDQGQDGRQQDGRGSGNTGPSTSNAFASALQGAGLNAASAARGAAGAAGPQESPSDQIAARIRAELTAGRLGETSSEGVVKVLSLELKPANLGVVTVRMTLKDNVISVHVEAQSGETRALIEREREKLTSTLAAAGYTVEAITAVQGEGARPSGVAMAGDGASPALQGQGNPGEGLADSAERERSGRPPPGGQEHGSESGNDDGGGVARRGVDGLYV